MSLSSKVSVVVPLYLLLTFVATESVSSEQCSQQKDKPSMETLAEELNKTEGLGSVGTSACKAKTEPYLKDRFGGNLRLETGLDFIRDDDVLRFGESLYFGEDEYSTYRRNQFSLMELVRSFIRELKGVRAFPLGPSSNMVTGDTEGNKRPAWCFYPYQLKSLAGMEITIYEILKDFYLNVLQKQQPGNFLALDSYFKDIEDSSLRSIFNVEYANEKRNDSFEDPYLHIATHPLLMYRMVRRFAEDLQPILLELEEFQDMIQDLYDQVNPDSLVFPNQEDLTDALDSLKRIQEGTDLNTFEFARGKLDQLQTDIHMNVLHALEMGTYYLTVTPTTNYAYAIEWLYYALDTVKQSPISEKYPIIEKFIRKIFNHAIEMHNQNWFSVSQNYWSLGVFHTKITPPFHPDSYTRMHEIMKKEAVNTRNVLEWNWSVNVNFMQVCSGKNIQTEKEKFGLKSWLQSKHNPYWTINPLKLELLNRDPPLYQIYDFIGDNLIEKMKAAAVPGLERSTVVDRNDPTKSLVDTTRTSSQVWLYDDRENGKFLLPLTRRMELMSQLTIEPPNACDAYQVASYGPSHHYAPHIDSFEDPRRCILKGNRIVTIMGYIGDVKAGGRTGFPLLGVAAEPVKGSIVMWYNLKKNGMERDMRTWHGGCPVVLGVKWITNKWVYYNENFRNFPCGLNSDE